MLTTQSLLRHAKTETQQALFYNIFCVSALQLYSESIVRTTIQAASSPAWHRLLHGPLPTEQFQGCPATVTHHHFHASQRVTMQNTPHQLQLAFQAALSLLLGKKKNNFCIPKGTETCFIPSYRRWYPAHKSCNNSNSIILETLAHSFFSVSVAAGQVLFPLITTGPNSPVFVNIHPTGSLPSAFLGIPCKILCFPIMYLLFNFSVFIISFALPLRKHWFSYVSSSSPPREKQFLAKSLSRLSKPAADFP